MGATFKSPSLRNFIAYLAKSAAVAYGEFEESDWPQAPNAPAMSQRTLARPTHKPSANTRIATAVGHFLDGLSKEVTRALLKT
jgi:hypothetical protein